MGIRHIPSMDDDCLILGSLSEYSQVCHINLKIFKDLWWIV